MPYEVYYPVKNIEADQAFFEKTGLTPEDFEGAMIRRYYKELDPGTVMGPSPLLRGLAIPDKSLNLVLQCYVLMTRTPRIEELVTADLSIEEAQEKTKRMGFPSYLAIARSFEGYSIQRSKRIIKFNPHPDGRPEGDIDELPDISTLNSLSMFDPERGYVISSESHEANIYLAWRLVTDLDNIDKMMEKMIGFNLQIQDQFALLGALGSHDAQEVLKRGGLLDESNIEAFYEKLSNVMAAFAVRATTRRAKRGRSGELPITFPYAFGVKLEDTEFPAREYLPHLMTSYMKFLKWLPEFIKKGKSVNLNDLLGSYKHMTDLILAAIDYYKIKGANSELQKLVDLDSKIRNTEFKPANFNKMFPDYPRGLFGLEEPDDLR